MTRRLHLSSSTIVLSGVWMCLALSLAAQPVPCTQYTSEDGLSENVVYCVHQDQDGFIWAGTDYGLNRFDAYQFKPFHHRNKDTLSLSNHSILCLREDAHGRFWIGTYAGLNHFDPHTGLVQRIVMPGKGSDYYVSDIYLDSVYLLFSTPNVGTFIYRLSDRTFARIDDNGNSYLSTVLFKFPGDRIGRFVHHTKHGPGIGLVDPLSGQLEFSTVQQMFPFAHEQSLDYYFRSSAGLTIFFSRTEKSLRVYNTQGQEIATRQINLFPGIDDLIIYDIEEVNEHVFWIATLKGLLVFDARHREFSVPSLTLRDRGILQRVEVRALHQDHAGNLWLGTFGEGLLHCNLQPSLFEHIELTDVSTAKSNKMILRLTEWIDGAVAAETEKHLFRLIRDGRPMEQITASTLTPDVITRITVDKSFSDLGAFQQHILRTKEMVPDLGFFSPFTFILHDDTTVIYQEHGIKIYQPASDRIVSEHHILNCAEDDQYYWLASDNGLHRIDKTTLRDSLIDVDIDNPHALSESFIYHVYKDTAGDLWLGTKGGGLNHFDRSQDQFIAYTTSDGLPDNVIYYIQPDAQGNLWLSTNKGLSRFDPVHRSFINFSRRDGLLNTEFNRLGGIRTADGRMYFAGTAGIDHFNPEEIQNAIDSTEIIISGISINGQAAEPSRLSALRYFQNDIIVHFTANEFVRPDLVYYRYRMRPDAPWTRVQGIPYANFSRLSPGSYLFEVQSSDDNFRWSHAASIPIYIKTPWWRTWWFIAMCAIAAAAGVYLMYLYRVRQLRKLMELRLRISQDLHDEIGTTLSSIHVYSSVATKTLEKDASAARKALSHIHRSSKKVMDNMNDIVWAIKTDRMGAGSLETKLKNYGYELLTPLNINVTYHIDKEIEKKLNHIEGRKNLLLIAKEAMNNIAKYSQATEAQVEISLGGRHLDLRISDNGKGFNGLRAQQGNGLHHMRRRAESMGGTFTLRSAENSGTSVQCQIPIANISNT